MAKTGRFTPRTQSTLAQIQDNAPNMSQSAPHGSPRSEPIGHIHPSINVEVQNSQENHVENQNSQETQSGDENPLPTYKRKSSKYWTVNIVDDGVPKEAPLQVQDLYSFPSQKKVLVEWNKEGQPIGEAGGLLGGFLGSIGADYDIFPIGYRRWPKVPSEIKDTVWDKTIKKIFQVDERHKKYIVENMGKKWRDTRVRLFAEFYNETLSWEENLESHPDGMDRDQWAAFMDYRLEEKTMDIFEKKIKQIEKNKQFLTCWGQKQLLERGMNWKFKLVGILAEQRCILLRILKKMELLSMMRLNRKALHVGFTRRSG